MTKLLIHKFVKDKSNRDSYGYLSGGVGICCNILLTIIKVIIGVFTNSVSIVADGINNLADASSNVFTIFGTKLASKPVDEKHPFGHGRMEYITALVMSFIIFMMSLELFKTSITKIINPEETKFNIISLVILIIAVCIKLWMGLFNKKLYQLSNNLNLKAVMKDCYNDCISTIATILALVISHFTSFKFIDGIVGIIVAIIIFMAGIDIIKDVISMLLGKAPDKELVEQIEKMMLEKEDIIGVHDLIIHDYGPGRIIASAHAEVPYNIDIMKIHDTIDNVEFEIKKKLNIEISIHMDPIVTDDETVNKYRNEVAQIIKEYNKDFSFHDFRVVEGPTHTNVIFDLVVPHKYTNNKKEVAADVRKLIHNKENNLFAVITVEHNYC